MGGDEPFSCEICDNLTSGYSVKWYILCYWCADKYRQVPDHIPISQWRKYIENLSLL